MTISYRDGYPDDAHAVAKLFTDSFVDTFGHLYPPDDLAAFLSGVSADRFRAELEDSQFALELALDDGAVVGFVKLGPPELPVETPPDTLELRQLYVLKDWHGAGVAARLMDWAIATAKDSGARHLQLSVFVDNHRARRFYERYGFHAVGRYDFMVGTHADDDIVLRHIVMQANE